MPFQSLYSTSPLTSYDPYGVATPPFIAPSTDNGGAQVVRPTGYPIAGAPAAPAASAQAKPANVPTMQKKPSSQQGLPMQMMPMVVGAGLANAGVNPWLSIGIGAGASALFNYIHKKYYCSGGLVR